jgi:acyl-CoA thioester hydrolase
MSERIPPASRAGFPHFLVIPTRWMDNDVYGHLNNVVYYALFDTVINRYLIDAGGLDIEAGAVIGVAVETGCRFHRSFAFPETIEAGLRVGHLGTRSVRYEVGLFGPGESAARADGHFVHVFVNRSDRRPTAPPAKLRAALARLVKPNADAT